MSKTDDAEAVFPDGPEERAALERFNRPPCQECGAMTEAEAAKKCIGGGDKDDCHGNHLWPDPIAAPQAVNTPVAQNPPEKT
jgi:hypothetical protein